MLVRVTAKNRLTLPMWVVEALGNPSHYEVRIDGDRLVLTPSRPRAVSVVHRKLQSLDLRESDVMDAIASARSRRKRLPT